jgi:integrase
MPSAFKREWTHKGVKKTAWVVRYVDPAGVKKQKTFKLKKTADEFADGIKSNIRQGVAVTAFERRTVSQLCDEFLRHTEARLRSGQITLWHQRNVKMEITCSVLPHLGGHKVNELTPLIIEQWFQALCREKSVGSWLLPAEKRRPLMPRTARARVASFKGVLDWAVRRGYISKNPCGDALKEIGGIPPARIRTFTPEQVALILRALEARGKHQQDRAWKIGRCAVHLAAFCGLRYGEIFGLTLPRVHIRERVLEIRHSLDRNDNLKGPKTKAGIRDVPLPQHVADLLADWIEHDYRPNDRQLLFRGLQRAPRCQDAVERTQRAKIHAPTFNRRYWRSLLARVGLLDPKDTFHFHALRHFAASWMIDNGLPITDVAQLLGHAKFDMTLHTYAHPLVGGRRRSLAFDRMASRLLAGDDAPVAEAVHNSSPAPMLVLEAVPQPVALEPRVAPPLTDQKVAVCQTPTCGALIPYKTMKPSLCAECGREKIRVQADRMRRRRAAAASS